MDIRLRGYDKLTATTAATATTATTTTITTTTYNGYPLARVLQTDGNDSSNNDNWRGNFVSQVCKKI
jgi:hypothetical protein